MIIAIIGGMGTGKTLLNTYFAYKDLIEGKRIFTNIKFNDNIMEKYDGKIQYLTKESIETLLDDLHTGKINLQNSTIAIQELHNYLDSRNSASKKNKLFTYFLLQSRHASPPTVDKKTGLLRHNPLCIIGDTQNLGQVDIRFRRNVDIILKPNILERDKNGAPQKLYVETMAFVGQDVKEGTVIYDVKGVSNVYNSWEIVDFSYQTEEKKKEPVPHRTSSKV